MSWRHSGDCNDQVAGVAIPPSSLPEAVRPSDIVVAYLRPELPTAIAAFNDCFRAKIDVHGELFVSWLRKGAHENERRLAGSRG
jgi:hypothetical protein